MMMQTFLEDRNFISLGHMFRRGLLGQGIIFNFFRSLQIVFYNVCTNLHLYTVYTNSFFYSFLHLLFFDLLITDIFMGERYYLMWLFKLHFSDNWCWSVFHIPVHGFCHWKNVCWSFWPFVNQGISLFPIELWVFL